MLFEMLIRYNNSWALVCPFGFQRSGGVNSGDSIGDGADRRRRRCAWRETLPGVLGAVCGGDCANVDQRIRLS